jgi:hypothetical protein
MPYHDELTQLYPNSFLNQSLLTASQYRIFLDNPDPADLLPMGKIREAHEAQEEAAEHLRKDMVFISKNLFDVGREGINFDTSASAVDANFYATLPAVSQLKKENPYAIRNHQRSPHQPDCDKTADEN